MAKAWKEFETKKSEKYEEWLGEVNSGKMQELAFPYPEIKVSSQFDKSESSIEEW